MSTAPISAPSQVIVRSGQDYDLNLLHDAFANAYGMRKSFYGFGVPSTIVIQKLDIFLASPRWRFLVACPSHLPREVMGILIYRIEQEYGRHAIAWLMTVWKYQRKGVAKALLKYAGIEPGEIDCPFLIPEIAKDAKHLGYTLRFRPYMPDAELLLQLQERIRGT